MRQSEARDLRSFLAEPVEELVAEGVKAQPDMWEDAEVGAQLHGVGARFISPSEPIVGAQLYGVGAPFISPSGANAQLHDVGVQFINGAEEQLHGTGVRFASPWEGTGGQLHEVVARFTQPLVISSEQDDLTLQQTMPIARIPELSGAQSGLKPLRPYRLQRYQSRGVPVSLSRSASGTLRLRPAGNRERRATADLAPAPQKIVPGESAPALQSWERRRRTVLTWLVLLTLFLLVILGGIGLDSLIASYR